MASGDLVLNLLSMPGLQRGDQFRAVADQLREHDLPGPAARFYDEARDFYARSNAHPKFIAETRDYASACMKDAAARGENPNIAFEPPRDDIAQYPNHFVRWYNECHRGNRRPWRAPTSEELEAEARAVAQAKLVKIEADVQYKADREAFFRRSSPELFRKRWAALLQAAAAADGEDEKALARAVALYRRPNDADEDYWKDGWTTFARQALQEELAKPPSDNPSVALRALPRIASDAEEWPIGPKIGALVFFCLLLPITWGLSVMLAGVAAFAAHSKGWGVLLLLPAAFFAPLTAILAIILTVLTPVVALVSGIILLVRSLPRHVAAKAALVSKDVRGVPPNFLFTADGGDEIGARPHRPA